MKDKLKLKGGSIVRWFNIDVCCICGSKTARVNKTWLGFYSGEWLFFCSEECERRYEIAKRLSD